MNLNFVSSFFLKSMMTSDAEGQGIYLLVFVPCSNSQFWVLYYYPTENLEVCVVFTTVILVAGFAFALGLLFCFLC